MSQVLPQDGDVIEWSEVAPGSAVKEKTVYRVEKKPLDREYLLVALPHGHAIRVSADEFKRGAWGEAKVVAAPVKEPAETAKTQPMQASDKPLFGAPIGE